MPERNLPTASLARKVLAGLRHARYVSCNSTLWVKEAQADVRVHLAGELYAGSKDEDDPPEIDDLKCTADEDIKDEKGGVFCRKGEAISLDPEAEEEGCRKLLESVEAAK